MRHLTATAERVGAQVRAGSRVTSLVVEDGAVVGETGRSFGGIPSWGYASGTSLGDGTFFGRRAGRAAAAKP